MRSVKQDFPFEMFCLCLAFMMCPTTSTLNGSLSTWRDAKSRLKEDLVAHKATKNKLSPGNNSAVKLIFSVLPYQVLKMDEVEQSVTTVSYVEVQWQDEDLAWNASDYENITQMGLDYNDLWHPNLIVINSADEDLVVIQSYSDRLLITNNGMIMLRTPVILRTTCDLDFGNYPFDSQKCEISILPFFDDCTFELNIINMTHLPNPFDFNGEWTIVARSAMEDYYNFTENNIPFVRVRLVLQRSFLFYVICILLPLVVTSLMTSLVFWIPPFSGEKVSFLVSIFVSAAVFLNFIADMMPRKLTNFPLITLFIIFVMMQCVIALLMTLFVIRRYDEEVLEASQDSDDAISEQIENILAMQQLILPSPFNPDQVPPKLERPVEIPHATEVSYSERLLLSLSALLQRKGKVAKPAGQVSHKKQTRRRKCRSCIKSRHWDFVFFMLFTAATITFYAKVLFPIYSEQLDTQNSEISTLKNTWF